jgi:ribonuclease G
VLETLRKALDEDRTKTFVVEISPLGLVEMTRQNVTDGVREIMTKACPTCDGEGVVKSEETIAIEIERKLRELAAGRGDDGPQAFLIRIHPKVTHQFTGHGGRMLAELERDTGCLFHFEGSEGLPLDHFSVTLEGSRDQVMQESVPFEEGDEVHVTLVEPHMYEADDAVAKIDGYVIDVVNGLAFVGEKKLVRIEEAGRAAARAVLLGEDAEQAAAAAEERRKERERPRRAPRARKAAPSRDQRPADTEPEREPEPVSVATIGAEAGEGVDYEDTPVVPTAQTETEVEADLEAEVKVLHGDEADAGAPDAGGEEGPGGEEQAAPNGEDPDAHTDGNEDDDSLQSRPRRRGRRGGRRRSRAKADVEAGAAEVPEASE